MRILIVGVGALGGVIGARLVAAGRDVMFAAKHPEQLARLRVEGIGGTVEITPDVRLLADCGHYDVAVLATKADDALAVAPAITRGLIVPIQNGAVSQLLAERYGDRVIGGISHLGATMHAPGHYEQRNAGQILIGELAGGSSQRIADLAELLNARTTTNMLGAIWTKLIINCSVTTLGAIAGTTMRGYIGEYRGLFDRVFAEAHAVASASGVTLDPMPDLAGLLERYGDLRPSMLQDFTRRRPTEIAYINGYVASHGERLGIPTPLDARIVEIVRAIERGELEPGLGNLALVDRS